jgi:hypothetical protein
MMHRRVTAGVGRAHTLYIISGRMHVVMNEHGSHEARVVTLAGVPYADGPADT